MDSSLNLNDALKGNALGQLVGDSQGSLQADEISFLQTIVNNSRFSIKPQNVNLTHRSRQPHAFSPISFATVSTSLTFVPEFTKSEERIHFKPIERSDGRFQLLTLDNNYSINEMKHFLLNTVLETGKALEAFEKKNRSPEFCATAQRVIALHEFGFPFPMERDEIADFLYDMEFAMEADKAMRAFWSNCYIVFGSYHCHRDIRNAAVISLPYSVDAERFKDAVEKGSLSSRDEPGRFKSFRDQILQGKGGRFNFTHEKFAPAERINERLVPRDRIDWYYYDTDIGRIGVLVCFDALDSRMLLRLAKLQLIDKDFNSQRFSMLIVPCFSPNENVADCCRLLSSILDTTVVYANVLYPENVATRGAPKNYKIREPQDSCDNTHGVYYRGRNVTGIEADAGFNVSPINVNTPTSHKDKNLWYITRFVCADRQEVEEKTRRRNDPAGLFMQIFS